MKKTVNGVKVDLTQEEIDNRNLEISKNQNKKIVDFIKSYRRTLVTSGISLNGVDIETDIETRLSLLGAMQLNTDIDWKTKSGFKKLKSSQVSAIANAVGVHIQKCFTVEKIVTEKNAVTPYADIDAVKNDFDLEYGKL